MRNPNRRSNERGAVAVIVALLTIFVFIPLLAFAIDLAYWFVARNELQNAADSAALAAARRLGENYLEMKAIDPDMPASYNCSDSTTWPCSDLKDVAVEVALANLATGSHITLNAEEVTIGRWDPNKDFEPIDLRFSAGAATPNAVKVRTLKDSTTNGPVSLFFARVFGHNFMNAEATAIAALTGDGKAEPGEIKLPVGMSELLLPEGCDNVLNFYSTGESCKGWHSFKSETQLNTSDQDDLLIGSILSDTRGTLENEACPPEEICGADWLKEAFPDKKQLLKAIDNGAIEPFESPETLARADEYMFDGGTKTGLFQESEANPAAMQTLFDYWKTHDEDGDPDTWTTTLPIYNDSGETKDSCVNPQGRIEIVGFVEYVVTGVTGSPNPTINGKVVCNEYEPGRGEGGMGYGTLGAIPNLVK